MTGLPENLIQPRGILSFMASIKDDRGYNQGFRLVKSTEVRMQRRADWMLSQMSATKNSSILEIGCGTGEVSHWIAEKTTAMIVGTDLCAPFIEEAKKKFVLPNLRYAVLDFNGTDNFNGERFDYIIGNGILHHLYWNLDDALVNMKRLLKENGKIIFIEPNYYNPYIYLIFTYAWLRKLAHLEPDEMAFSKSFILGKLHLAGYEEAEVDYRDFLIPGVPDLLIRPSIAIGDVLEKIPFVKYFSQSLFIRATKAGEIEEDRAPLE
jgi:SAM-dependent methyltransferase